MKGSRSLFININSCINLPLLGLRHQPQAYVIMRYASTNRVSSISKKSKNPIWMFQSEITLLNSKQDLLIQENNKFFFYIFNCNKNAQDQLLGWVQIPVSELVNKVQTQSKYQLRNSQSQKINSFVTISSYLLTKTQSSNLSPTSCIKFQLLNQVQILYQDDSQQSLQNCQLTFKYCQDMIGLKYNINDSGAFRYKGGQIIQVYLNINKQNLEQIVLSSSFNINNLSQCQAKLIKLRFFNSKFPKINYLVLLNATIIPNAYLQQNNRSLQLCLEECDPQKQDFLIIIQSPIDTILLSSAKQPKRIYCQNGYWIILNYFQTKQIENKQLFKKNVNDQEQILKQISKCKPIASQKVQINNLRWNNELTSYTWKVPLFKIQKSINISFKVNKKSESLKLKINPINLENQISDETNLTLQSINVKNCYFFQVFPSQTKIWLYHIDFSGIVTQFGTFQIKTNQTEYIVQSRCRISNKGGTLIAICFQMSFKQNNQKLNIQNGIDSAWLQINYIFKITIPKDNKGQLPAIIYNRNFLSFSKQVSLTKVCKQFSAMIHDSTLSVNFKKKESFKFLKGIMNIINCKFEGLQSQNSCTLRIGQNILFLTGFGNQFLLSAAKTIYVQNQKVRVTFKINKNEYNGCYLFNDLFGNPINTSNQQKIYLLQISVQKGKFYLYFKYKSNQSNQNHLNDIIEGEKILQKYNPVFSIKLKLQAVHFYDKNLNVNNLQSKTKSIKIRFSQQDSVYESLKYQSNSNLFLFGQEEYFTTKGSQQKGSQYIFISIIIDCKYNNQKQNDQNQQNSKWPKFFNGFINIKTILGKGIIQIPFSSQQSTKSNLFLKISNQTMNHKALMSNPNNKIKINPETIQIQYLMKQLQSIILLKPNAYYFLLIYINDNYQCMISAQNQGKKEPTNIIKMIQNLKCSFQFGYQDKVRIDILINSKKINISEFQQKYFQQINKNYQRNYIQRSLNSFNFVTIASGMLSLENFQINNLNLFLKSENKKQILKSKQNRKASIILNLFPTQENMFKLNQQYIQIIKKAIKASLTVQFEITQTKVQNQAILAKSRSIDVNVLNVCIGLLYIQSIENSVISKRQNRNSLGLGYSNQQETYLQINGITIPLSYKKLSQNCYTIKIQKSQINLKIKKNNIQVQKSAKTIVLPSSLKTNQKYQSAFQIQGYKIKYVLKCKNNQITSFGGSLKLDQIIVRGSSIQNIRIVSESQNKKLEALVKINKNQGFPNLSINTKSNINSSNASNIWNINFNDEICFLFTLQNKKCIIRINIADISINNINQSFTFQINFNDKVVFTLKGTTQVNKIQQNNSQKLSIYKILKRFQGNNNFQQQIIKLGNGLQLKVPQSLIKKQNLNKQDKEQCQPQRKQGIRIQLKIPILFYEEMQLKNKLKILEQLTIVFLQKKIKLNRSKQNHLIYYAYAQKKEQIQLIQFNTQFLKAVSIAQKTFSLHVQLLQSQNGNFKFIINQDPKYIIFVNQYKFRIPSLSQKNQFLISINLHRFIADNYLSKILNDNNIQKNLTQNKKRLAWLTNSQNDQIITNKFCLYLKHGKQEYIIHNIDLQGQCAKNNIFQTAIFGYDQEDDQIDIYLCIEHFWNYQKSLINKQIKEQFSYQKIQKQWLQIMPLWHYVIKLSDISVKNRNIAIQMNQFKYQKIISLSYELNKIIPRQNCVCLMDLSYQKGSWGYLKTKINKLGPIYFNPSYQNLYKKSMCYLKLSIESQLGTFREIITQPQQMSSQNFLCFKNNLQYFYLRKLNTSQQIRLKIELFLVCSANPPQLLFYKFYPFTQFLSKKVNQQKIFVNVNQGDCKNKCHGFQIQVQVSNSKQVTQKNMDNKAKQINDVDMISYKDKTMLQILIILLNCTKSSHFTQVLNQIKQSFVYEELILSDKNSPLHLIIPLTTYLLTNFKESYSSILEILQMCLVKNQSIINYLQNIQLKSINQTTQNIQQTQFLYKCFKSIVLRQKQETIKENSQNKRDAEPYLKQVKNLQVSVKNENNGSSLWKYFEKPQNLQKFLKIVKLQTDRIESQQQQKFKYVQQNLLVQILSIIKICLTLSQSFSFLVNQDLMFWIQELSFKGQNVFQKLVQIIQQVARNHQTKKKNSKQIQARKQSFQRIIQIMISRNYDIDKLLQFWVDLSPQRQINFYEQIMKTYFIQPKTVQSESKSIQAVNNISDKKNQEKTENAELLIKKAKALKFFLYQLRKLQKQNSKNSKINSVKSSRIEQVSKNNENQISFRNQINLNYFQQEILSLYFSYFASAIESCLNIGLISSVSQLLILMNELKLFSQQNISKYVTITRKWLDNKIKSKNSEKNNYNKIKESQNSFQGQIKRILQNFLSQLVGKTKKSTKQNKNQIVKNQMKFSKFSKYLITNDL